MLNLNLPGFSGCVALFVAPFVDATATPWETALQFDYSASAQQFERQHDESPNNARIAIGYASTLLSLQPRTESNIEKAHRLLEGVASSAPASSDEAPLAIYLLARIEQDHLSPARTDSALRRYELLLAQGPGTPVADYAAVQLALHTFRHQETDRVQATVDRLQSLLSAVRSPDASRDLHFLLGNVFWRDLQDGPRALAHFIKMREFSSALSMRDAEIDLIIGGIASEIGEHEVAVKHYESFLAQLPRDIRSSTVRSRLDALRKPLQHAVK